jgi:hypothetical protein
MSDPTEVEEILRDNARELGAELIPLGNLNHCESVVNQACPVCASISWRFEGDFRRCTGCAELWRPN